MPKTKTLVTAALWFALIFVMTYSVKIPLPGAGYAHLGDAVLFLSAFSLSPWLAFGVGGLASALADVVGGYALYAPVTFLIKGLMAGLMVLCLRRGRLMTYGGLIALGLLMVGGYFCFEWATLDLAIALADIPGNLLQAGVGVVVAALLAPAVKRLVKQLA